MKYIASCSFGKDSLAAIHVRMEHGEPVDEAVYCRIMFDDTISAELPEHEGWIHETAIPLLQSRYGIKTTIVQADTNYVRQFYTKYRCGRWVGYCYGWPFLRGPWCNSRLKVRPINRWQKEVGAHIAIVGIAADEHKRKGRKAVEETILPLVDYGITEAQAFDICRKADLLSPAYNGGRQRLGCWFCHNQRLGEFRRLRREHPALWKRMLELDNEAHRRFTPRASVHDLDRRFELEERQMSLFE